MNFKKVKGKRKYVSKITQAEYAQLMNMDMVPLFGDVCGRSIIGVTIQRDGPSIEVSLSKFSRDKWGWEGIAKPTKHEVAKALNQWVEGKLEKPVENKITFDDLVAAYETTIRIIDNDVVIDTVSSKQG